MEFETLLIRLRPFMRRDRDVTRAWRNTPAIRDAAMGFRFPVTDVMEDRWYDKVLDGLDKTQSYFAIEIIETSELVGFCSLTDIDYQSLNAQFGIMIGKSSGHGHGIGADALALTLSFAFNSLNLHRIYIIVRSKNERAINLFKKYAFRDEGVLRQHFFSDGHYEDVLLMALLREEYEPLSS